MPTSTIVLNSNPRLVGDTSNIKDNFRLLPKITYSS
jgi:hypothetical protein